MLMRFASPLLVLFLVFSIAACGGGEDADMDDDMAADTTEMMDEQMVTSNTIVDVAVNDGRFTTLVDALGTTGLAETLKGDGPFTVFAPTDDAFAALPEGTLAGLSSEQLANILTYHVVNGSMMAADVGGMQMIPTAQGTDLAVTVGDDGSVKINDANVIITDIHADNGVIHVIDAVLMPPMDDDAM
jgi:uncharacterized surface protein with fasciclin (FAS1) repeats